MRMETKVSAPYKLSLVLAGLSGLLLAVWSVWAIVGATTGWGRLSYTGVAFLSPQLGGTLAFLSLLVIVRSRQVGRPMRHALFALLVSLVFAVLPVVTFVATCDGCMD
jgi:hypothetical protein